MRSPFADRRGRPLAAALLLAGLLGACEFGATEAPPCHPGMPAAAEVRSASAFAPLAYHRRALYEQRRGSGYDLWGDSRFQYRTALEFTLVPKAGARSDDEVCVHAMALRLALPADGDAAAKIEAFERAAWKGGDAEVRAAVRQSFAAGTKYQSITRRGNAEMAAGRIVHPSRGELFVLSVSWPRP